MSTDHIKNHYVPKWYQRRLIPNWKEHKNLYYLDLFPEVQVNSSGYQWWPKNPRVWGINKCFYEENLYTKMTRGIRNINIERFFAEHVEDNGPFGIGFFDLAPTEEKSAEARLQKFVMHLSLQYLRTPKGLQIIKREMDEMPRDDPRDVMMEHMGVFGAPWLESIWAIADANDSKIKFILSDHPVTLYNPGFPSSITARDSIESEPKVGQYGTYTLFPIDLNRILIITNLAWICLGGDPFMSPLFPRYQMRGTLISDLIQTGRTLNEEEVLKVNYILKSRAFRYIAASDRKWLYPERYISPENWAEFDSDYLLMPDPRLIPFYTLNEASPDIVPNVNTNYFLNPAEYKAYQQLCNEFHALFGSETRGTTQY